MESLKQKLQADYNRVRNAWGRIDYVDYLRQLRPAMEDFCRIVIMDVKGPNLYEEIVDGEYPFDGIKNLPKGQPIRNSLLARVIVPLVLEEKTLNKEDLNRLKGATNRLTEAFSITSELGNHTEKSPLNPELRAYDNMQLLPACAESLITCGILSKDVSTFFSQILIPLEFSKENAVDAQRILDEKYLELKQQLMQRESEIVSQKAQINEANERALSAQREAFEAEKTKAAVNSEIERLNQQINELQQQLSQLQSHDNQQQEVQELSPEVDPYAWNIDEGTMDDDQLDLIERNTEKSMLVAGCAGSGKSVIALHKAQQLLKTGASVILIAYTKSLRGFMNIGWESAELKAHCMYHYQWKDQNMPSADYIIVDEIQDFTKNEIREFIDAAKKCFFFFGDTAQSIYRFTDRRTMTIEQIAEMTSLDILMLYNNYRLPRPVAKITQDYVGIDVQPYKDRVYQSKEKDLPHIVGFKSDAEQIQTLVELFKNTDMSNVGILLPDNNMVVELYERLLANKVHVECKYSLDRDLTINTLNFNTPKPKLMTYHSAKGLQFKRVILPFCLPVFGEDNQKALYVAMTRTQKELTIMYSGDVPPAPLDKVPKHLFLKTLS